MYGVQYNLDRSFFFGLLNIKLVSLDYSGPFCHTTQELTHGSGEEKLFGRHAGSILFCRFVP